MSINYNDILSKIVSTKDKANEGITKHLLKTDIIGNVITGRFLPNLKDVNAESGSIPTEFSSYFHFIKSKIDGTNIYVNCLNTIGQRCPVCTKSIEMWRSSDDRQKERSKSLRRQHSFITNFYVINDVKNPVNNGKVMLLKYGKQIDMKIKGALEGELAQYYGTRIYRLDEGGCTFMLKPEKNADKKDSWVTYTNSSFLPASAIPDMTEEKINTIMENVIALAPLYNKCKTSDELIELMNKHYFINDVQQTSNADVASFTNVLTQSSKQETPASASTPAPSAPKKAETVNEEELDAMLNELGE